MKSKVIVLSILVFLAQVVTITHIIMANKEIEAWKKAARAAVYYDSVELSAMTTPQTPEQLEKAIDQLIQRPTADQHRLVRNELEKLKR